MTRKTTSHDKPTMTIGMWILLALVTAGVVASVVLATDVYLLMFLAILCGVLFTHLAQALSRWSPLPYGGNLAVVVTTTLALAIATVVFFGWRIEDQLQKASKQFDQSYDRVLVWLEKHPTAKAAFGRVPFAHGLLEVSRSGASNHSALQNDSDSHTSEADGSQPNPNGPTGSTLAGRSNDNTLNSVSGKVIGIIGKLFSTTFGATMNVAFVLFVGVFLATKPQYYRDCIARLFPQPQRRRVIEILNKLGDTLFNWLQGRAATMTITGIGTSMFLAVLGVPLAVTLGVITGGLTFIPTVGAFVALILSMLVAMSQGPATVMWVIVLYAVLQFVESNIITPLIQQHQTSVPPPVLLSAQLMMGVLTGFLGVIVSTPLAASVIVLIQEAYLKDILGEDVATEGD